MLTTVVDRIYVAMETAHPRLHPLLPCPLHRHCHRGPQPPPRTASIPPSIAQADLNVARKMSLGRVTSIVRLHPGKPSAELTMCTDLVTVAVGASERKPPCFFLPYRTLNTGRS